MCTTKNLEKSKFLFFLHTTINKIFSVKVFTTMRKKEITPKTKRTISTQTTAIKKEMKEEEKKSNKDANDKKRTIKKKPTKPNDGVQMIDNEGKQQLIENDKWSE